MELMEEKDLVLTLGAGDIWRVGEELAERLALAEPIGAD
jgi:UDP-N-acetylmuramate-alanine ligase